MISRPAPACRSGDVLSLQLQAGAGAEAQGAVAAAAGANGRALAPRPASGAAGDAASKDIIIAAVCVVSRQPGSAQVGGPQRVTGSRPQCCMPPHAASAAGLCLPAALARSQLRFLPCSALHCSALQTYVPLIARALPVPAKAQQGPVGVELPLGGAHPPAAAAAARGLAVVLIHQRSTQMATLVSLACGPRRRASSSSNGKEASHWSSHGGSGTGKPVSASVSAAAAFQLVASGSNVAYSVIPLDDLLGGGTSRGSEARQQQVGGWTGRRVADWPVVFAILGALRKQSKSDAAG